ncbi:hypothetical protein BH11PLA2_BH11PLA2_48620 [soil metagenome]
MTLSGSPLGEPDCQLFVSYQPFFVVLILSDYAHLFASLRGAAAIKADPIKPDRQSPAPTTSSSIVIPGSGTTE